MVMNYSKAAPNARHAADSRLSVSFMFVVLALAADAGR